MLFVLEWLIIKKTTSYIGPFWGSAQVFLSNNQFVMKHWVIQGHNIYSILLYMQLCPSVGHSVYLHAVQILINSKHLIQSLYLLQFVLGEFAFGKSKTIDIDNTTKDDKGWIERAKTTPGDCLLIRAAGGSCRLPAEDIYDSSPAASLVKINGLLVT